MSDIADQIRDLLPHHTFDIRVRCQPSGATVLRIRCRCGRAFDWAGQLPGELLHNWLTNHATITDDADAMAAGFPVLPRRGFETANEPFLQPDYIAAPVVGAPGEPIALWRREGGAT